MRQTSIPICFGLLAALACGSPALAQSMTNPLGTVGNDRYSISAEWNQNNRSLELDEDSDMTANWYGLKAAYGLYDWLDLCGFAGYADCDVWRKRGSYKARRLFFSYGGGFKLQALADNEHNMRVLLSGAATHVSGDDFIGNRPPGSLTWNELQVSLSLARQFGWAMPYAGLTYSVMDGEISIDGREGEFTDPGGLLFAGIDFILPSRHILTLQADGRMGGTSHEFSFMVGLSQRSK